MRALHNTVRLVAIAGLCTGTLWTPAFGSAIATKAPAANGERSSAQRIATQAFSDPRVTRIGGDGTPISPGGGWVKLALMVDPKGKPFEVAVTASSGNSTLDQAAVRSVRNSTFQPGMLNGKPIESSMEVNYVFQGPDEEAGRAFYFSYRALERAVKAKDRSAADAAMKSLTVTNLYEDAYYGLAQYRYASVWGSKTEQLGGLQRAIAGESRGHYLPSTLFAFALRTSMRLELETHQYAEALDTWKSLNKAGVDAATVAAMKQILASLEILRKNNQEYGVSGTMPEGKWFLHLFKRHFRATVTGGFISEVKLRCERTYLQFPFDPSQEYTVGGKYGNCIVEFDGDPGTHFTFFQS